MERKICTRCIVEKNFEDFYKKYTEGKYCNKNSSLKYKYENYQTIKLSNRKKL